ncbi:MAG: putative CCAAT/enhancer-binding protein, partial [Streblomastix strix]
RDVQFKMQSIGEEKKSKKQKKKEEKLKNKKSARSNSNVKQKEKEIAPTHEQVLENKLLTAVISGVSKVYSIAKVTSAQFEKHLDSLYRAAHSNSLATSLRALMLLEKILYPQGPLPDRYYTSMYDLLYSQSIMSETNTHPALLGLIYKSCKIDSHTQRVASFVKRLLQISLIQIPTFTIGALMVVAELLSENRALLHSLLTEKEDEGIVVVKVGNELSGMKKDKEKQLNQQNVQKIGQKSGKVVEIKDENDEVKSEYEDDDNEGNLTEKQIKSNNSTNNNNTTSLHSDKYDPSKRNPRYSGADATGLWEIRILASHYHPTVSHLANQILQAGLIESQKLEKIRKLSNEKDIRSGIAVKQEGNEVKMDIEKQKVDNKEIINMNDLDSINALDMLKVNYTSDPFEDFSLSAFLNRFAFKNPKKKKKEEEEQKNENKKDQKKLEKDSNEKKNEQIDSKIKIEKQDISDKESEDEEVNPLDNNNDDDLMSAKSFLPKHTNQQQPSNNLQQIQQSNITLHSSTSFPNSFIFQLLQIRIAFIIFN